LIESLAGEKKMSWIETKDNVKIDAKTKAREVIAFLLWVAIVRNREDKAKHAFVHNGTARYDVFMDKGKLLRNGSSDCDPSEV